MKKVILSLIFLTATITNTGICAENFVKIIDSVKDSVVSFKVQITKEAFQKKMQEMAKKMPPQYKQNTKTPRRVPEGSGSGMIIDKKGYILTNYHVIKDAKIIKIIMSNHKTYMGELIGASPRYDMAVVKIDPKDVKLTPVKFGNSDKIKCGESVLAIGSPFGKQNSVSAGIISAKERISQNYQYNDEGQMVLKSMPGLIQTDASINPGNSGGPLINLAGEVIGINTMIISRTGEASGVGYAIPANLAKTIITKMMTGDKTVGENTPFIGAQFQDLDDRLSEAFKIEEGVLLSHIEKYTAAEKAGLKAGDIIVKFNGKDVEDTENLMNFISFSNVNEEVKIDFIRGGQKDKTSIILDKTENTEKETSQRCNTYWGKAENSGTTLEKIGLELEEKEDGLRVINISKNTPAYDSAIQEDDVIIKINNSDEIPTLKLLGEAIDNKKEGYTVMLVKYLCCSTCRRVLYHYVVIK